MEIQTEYIVGEMAPPQTQTAEQLLVEGKRLLDSGDKLRALANLVMATKLSPDNETAWLLRAKATSDPQEAVECLEQVLAINPQNHQAREDLIDVRMYSLQEGVRDGIDARVAANETGTRESLARLASNQFVRLGVLAFVLVFCGFSSLTLAAVFAFLNNASGAGAIAVARPTATWTEALFQLPPTWTPSPTPPPTRTPLPSPTPSGRAKANLTVRAGPGTNFPRLGTVLQNSALAIIGRSVDGKYLEIEYSDTGKPGWVLADAVELGGAVLTDLAITTPLPITPAPTKVPVTVAPTAKPTNTPIPQVDFVLGRPIESVADCGQQWKIAGTVYSNQSGSQRLNGTLIRVWAFSQLQGTVGSGSLDYLKPGYWEWTFSRGSDVQGEIAVVSPDGSLRSQPIGYHLTSQCDGSGVVNQMIIDFVGLH